MDFRFREMNFHDEIFGKSISKTPAFSGNTFPFFGELWTLNVHNSVWNLCKPCLKAITAMFITQIDVSGYGKRLLHIDSYSKLSYEHARRVMNMCHVVKNVLIQLQKTNTGVLSFLHSIIGHSWSMRELSTFNVDNFWVMNMGQIRFHKSFDWVFYEFSTKIIIIIYLYIKKERN